MPNQPGFLLTRNTNNQSADKQLTMNTNPKYQDGRKAKGNGINGRQAVGRSRLCRSLLLTVNKKPELCD